MFKRSLSFLLNFSISSFSISYFCPLEKKNSKKKGKSSRNLHQLDRVIFSKTEKKAKPSELVVFFPTDIFLLSTTKEDLFSFQTRFAPLVCVCGEEKEGKKIPLNRVRAIHIWCQHLCVRVFHHPLRRPRKKRKEKWAVERGYWWGFIYMWCDPAGDLSSTIFVVGWPIEMQHENKEIS